MIETIKEFSAWEKTADKLTNESQVDYLRRFRLCLLSKIADGDPLGLKNDFGLDDKELYTMLKDALGEKYTALEVSEKIGRSKVWIHRWSKIKNVGTRRDADGVYVYTESDVETLRGIETTRGRKKEDEKIKILKHE